MEKLATFCAAALALGGALGTALAEEPPKKAVKSEPIADSPEFKMAMWQAIMSTASQIDRCTQRHATTFPGTKGQASIWYEIAPKDGRVAKVKVTTALKGQDNLVSCLKDVARSWRFPKTEPNVISSTLTVSVAEGHKFRLLKPGEKPPEVQTPEQQAENEGWLRFTPSFPKEPRPIQTEY